MTAQPGEERTWRGEIVAEPGSFVACSILSDGKLYARIVRNSTGVVGVNYWIESLFGPFDPEIGGTLPSGITQHTHVVYEGKDVIKADGSNYTPLNIPVTIDDLAIVSVAELALDVDAEYYATYARDPVSIENNVRYAEEHASVLVNMLNVPYERYTAIQHQLTSIVVRAVPTNADPYRNPRSGGRDGELRTTWSTTDPLIGDPLLRHHDDVPYAARPLGLPRLFRREFRQLTPGLIIGQLNGGPMTCGSPPPGADRKGVSTAADIHRTPNVARRAQVAAHEIGHGWTAVHTTTVHMMDPATSGAMDIAPSNVSLITARKNGSLGCLTLGNIRPPRRVYQAEAAARQGGTVSTAIPGFIGSSHVNFTGDASQYLEWELAGMLAPGQHDLVIRYSNADSSTCVWSLSVNGAVVVSNLVFSKTASDEWKTLRIPAVLSRSSGTNAKVRLTSTTIGGGVDVDQLEIIRYGTLLYGDTDVDGDVDTADSSEFYANWTGALPPGTGGKRWDDGDFDGDADVDTADQSLLIGGWTGALPAPTPELSIIATAATADEPSHPGQFALILAPPPLADMLAKFKVLGSAVHGTDYVMWDANGTEIELMSGVATVAVPPSGLFTIYVDTTNDSVAEGRETVRLEAVDKTVYEGMEYTLSTRRYADVVIAADTAEDTEGSIPEVNVIAIDRTASEPQSGSGGDTATFLVTASPAPSSNITVPFVLSGEALSTSDYTPVNPQSVTIGTAGFADVTISPVAQSNGEFTETVTLGLTSGTGYAVGPDNSATAHIVESDNGKELFLKIEAYLPNLVEGDRFPGTSDPVPLGAMPFLITANRVPPKTTLQIRLTGTATLGSGPGDTANDYYLTSADGILTLAIGPPTVATLTIEPQGQEFYLIVWPIDDGQAEPVQTVIAEILPSPTSSYTPADPSGGHTISIQDAQ